MSRLATRAGNGSSLPLPESAEALRAVLRTERSELKRTLNELEAVVRGNLDLRSRLLDHPLATVGAACAVGVLLGVLSGRSSSGGDARDTAGRTPRRRRNSAMSAATRPFARLATALTGAVAARLADVAGDAARRALAAYAPAPRRD